MARKLLDTSCRINLRLCKSKQLKKLDVANVAKRVWHVRCAGRTKILHAEFTLHPAHRRPSDNAWNPGLLLRRVLRPYVFVFLADSVLHQGLIGWRRTVILWDTFVVAFYAKSHPPTPASFAGIPYRFTSVHLLYI